MQKLSQTEKLFITLGFVIASTLSILATSEFGIGVSTDGVYYLSAANNLAGGNGLVDYKGFLLVTWPPLLPSLIAILTLAFNTSSLFAAHIINLIAIFFVMLSTAKLIKLQEFQTHFWLYIGIATIAVSPSFLGQGANLGSDLLFIALANWFLIAAIEFSKSGQHNYLVSMAALAAVSSLLRWIGVVLIVIGALVMLRSYWKRWSQLLAETAIFCLLSAAPFLLWTSLRNYRLSGTLLGPRNLSAINIQENIAFTLARIEDWFLPDFITNRIPSIFVVLTLAAVIFLLQRSLSSHSLGKKFFSSPSSWILLVFSVLYLASVVVTTFTEDHIYTYDDRYQLVAFVPIMVLLFAILDKSVYLHLRRRPAALISSAVLWALLWLGYNGFISARFIGESYSEGVPHYNVYNVRNFHASTFIQYLEQYDFKPENPVFSNDAAAFYFYTNNQVRNSPNTPGGEIPDNPSSAFRDWASESSYLVWFTPNPKWNYLSPNQLARFSEIRLIHTEPDGTIYLITPE